MEKQNQFLKNVRKNDTVTENLAPSHSTTGDDLADQFSKAGSFRGRLIDQVFAEQGGLHEKYGIWALRFVFYLRLITRIIKSSIFTSTTVQNGQGNRDESFKRFLWYLVNIPEVFYRNLYLFTIVGSYRDILDIMFLAKQNKINIDFEKCICVFVNPENDLFKKYVPVQKSLKKCTTERSMFRNKLAIKIANFLEISNNDLRELKSSGKAHVWQQLLSKRFFEKIDFNLIPGKALFNLVNGKFLTKHNLEQKYLEWINKQPTAKFTGYVYELGMKVKSNMPIVQKVTIDKQFEHLVQLAKKSNNGLTNRKIICAVDRSDSMEEKVANTRAMNISESLGLFFSSLIEGAFKNWLIVFSKRSNWLELKGGFCDRKLSMQWNDCPSNTDFQSIIDSFVRTRQQFPNVPESDFPNTLLVVSDMQFDRTSHSLQDSISTNYQVAIEKLSSNFSKEYVDNFIFIWWDCTGRITTNQPQSIDEPGGYVLSGFDGSILTLLLGKIDKKENKLSMEKSIEEILSQEVLMLCE